MSNKNTRMFVPYGTKAKQKMEGYKGAKRIVDTIVDGGSLDQVKEVFEQEFFRRVDRPVSSSMKKGGQMMGEHIFGDD